MNYVPQPPKNLPPADRQPRYGYITTRSLAVDVAPIENAGKIVDAATSSGVTAVDGVAFDLKDRKAAYQEALVAAMKDAQASAAALARGGDIRLARIVRVSRRERRRSGPALPRRASPRGPWRCRQPPTEIAPSGPIDVNAHVDITYEIR